MTHSLVRRDPASTPAVKIVGLDNAAVSKTDSSNVFADLGFENSEDEQIKADIVLGIADIIKQRRLSQVAAARTLGLSQPDVSKLLRGRTGGYSLERLLAFTRALGNDVEITVRRSKSTQAGHLNLRVLEMSDT